MNWFERVTANWQWPTIEQILTSLRENWVLWLVWLGLFVATVLLVRMLITRWGQKNEVQKSLALSILLHTVILLYTTTLPIVERTMSAEPRDSIRIRTVTSRTPEGAMFGVNQGGTTGKGHIAIWQQLPKPIDDSLERLTNSPPQPVEITSPTRKGSELPDAPVTTPSLPEPAATTATPPETVTSATKPDVSVDANPTKIAEETAEARDAQPLPTAAASRQGRPVPGVATAPVDRKTQPGTTEPTAIELNPITSAETTAVPAEPEARLPRGAETGRSQSRLGPLPSQRLEDDEPGAPAGRGDPGLGGGAISAKPLARLGNSQRASGGTAASPTSAPSRNAAAAGTATGSPDATVTLPSASGRGENSVPIDDAAPRATRPDFGLSFDKQAAQQARPYELRTPSKRKQAAASMGATDASERAVESGLQWLARHQSPDGSWDADGFAAMCPPGDVCRGHARIVEFDATAPFTITDGERARLTPEQLRSRLANLNAQQQQRQMSGIHADAGLTGLAVLAFLGAGYTHEEGVYADTVDRALRWLVKQQSADGFLGGKAAHYARMYCHGMAAISLGEAYGMTGDTSLRSPLAAAVRYIVSTQNSDGGWRYSKGTQGDMSMFGWQLMALKSAATAGLDVPQESLDIAITFLRNAGLGQHGGLAAYRLTESPKPSMTAEALFCRQMLGMKRTNPATAEATNYLLQNPPRRAEPDLYYWYYGTLAMYQYGGDGWRTWNAALLDSLVLDQRTSGHSAGSWEPRAPWGDYGGRVYSTAMSTLCLEVYYRFLPLYQMGSRREEP